MRPSFYWPENPSRHSDSRRRAVCEKPGRPLEDDNEPGGTFGDLIPGDGADLQNKVLNPILRDQLAAALWPMVDALPGDQPSLIRGIYQKGQTIQEAGKSVGMTKEKAASERQKALAALRKGKNRAKLEAYHSRLCYSYGLKSSLARWKTTFTSGTEAAAIKIIELLDKAGSRHL